MLLVEQKSRGKNPDAALEQALSYFPGLAERDLPQIVIVIVIVCDFALSGTQAGDRRNR